MGANGRCSSKDVRSFLHLPKYQIRLIISCRDLILVLSLCFIYMYSSKMRLGCGRRDFFNHHNKLDMTEGESFIVLV